MTVDTSIDGYEAQAQRRAEIRARDARLSKAIELLRPKLINIARRRWSGPEQDLEDFVQQGIFEAWDSRESIGPNIQAHEWEAHLAGRVSAVAHRERMRAVRSVESVAVPEDGPNAIASACKRNRPQVFKEVYADRIAALPEKYRHVVCLHLDGLNNSEIAEQIGYKRGSWGRSVVAARLDYAQNELKATIPELDPADIDMTFFDRCAKITVYHPPKQPWLPWTQHHPGPLVLSPARVGQRAEIGLAKMEKVTV